MSFLFKNLHCCGEERKEEKQVFVPLFSLAIIGAKYTDENLKIETKKRKKIKNECSYLHSGFCTELQATKC